MINVKITTNFSSWPLIRQTPSLSGVWGDCRFFINQEIDQCDYWVVYEDLRKVETTICNRENTIFITGEPPSVKKYRQDFLSQFGTIITSHKNMNHPRVIYCQQAQLWMIGVKYLEQEKRWQAEPVKNYDDFKKTEFYPKTKLISFISSSKKNTEGHKKRLQFAEEISKYFKDKIDIFGNGVKTISDKWDAISPYKYSIVIENSSLDDYWTEKLSDTFLGGAYPLYYGCPNISDYFSTKSYTSIDIYNYKKSISMIEQIIDSNKYEESIEELKQAKNLVLDKYNLFALIDGLVDKSCNLNGNKKTSVKLKPESNHIHYNNNSCLKNIINEVSHFVKSKKIWKIK